jgi:hypothetical protein
MPYKVHRDIQEDEFGNVLLNELEVRIAAELCDVIDATRTKLSIPTTLWPRDRRRSTRCDPKKPAAPVTTEAGRMALDFLPGTERRLLIESHRPSGQHT